jgi:hypothetical protein
MPEENLPADLDMTVNYIADADEDNGPDFTDFDPALNEDVDIAPAHAQTPHKNVEHSLALFEKVKEHETTQELENSLPASHSQSTRVPLPKQLQSLLLQYPRVRVHRLDLDLLQQNHELNLHSKPEPKKPSQTKSAPPMKPVVKEEPQLFKVCVYDICSLARDRLEGWGIVLTLLTYMFHIFFRY